MVILLAAAPSIFIFLPCRAASQELSHRLILKDGSYQLVTKYEVKGERVRYLSAERNEWEELPSALIDWPATDNYEKGRATAVIPEAVAIDKETEAEREAELARLPQVAPGLRLPEESGVFLLDNYGGEPQLVELQQMEGDVDARSRGNIFRTPLSPAGSKQTIELAGEHATIHSHSAVPSIYINVEDGPNNQPPPGETASAKLSQPSLDAPRAQPQGPEQPQQPEGPVVPFDRYRIVRAKVKKGSRILGDVKRNASGKVSQNEDFVPTTIDRIGTGWFKLTPVAALTPGEYVLVEMRGAEGMNLYVWDFNVDATAPANANPWKAEKKN
jgi:hypothetical protein